MKRKHVLSACVLLLPVLLFPVLTGCGRSDASGAAAPSASSAGSGDTLPSAGGNDNAPPEDSVITVGSAEELPEAIDPV